MYIPQTNNQLRTSSNPRNQATVQDGRVVVQNVQGRQNRGQGNNALGCRHKAGTAHNPKMSTNKLRILSKTICCVCKLRRMIGIDVKQLLNIGMWTRPRY
ncbi:hypothetical protein Tco_1466221 [Tanacetum coccineum]